MKVMVAFLLGLFIAAGVPRSREFVTRPRNLALICVLVAASFYSLRVVG